MVTRFTVRVKAGSSVNKVVQGAEDEYVVYTTALAEHNQANKAVLRMLSEYFKLPAALFSIRLGKSSREKLIEAAVAPEALTLQLRDKGHSNQSADR